jgi:hypothetical protein
MICRQGDILGSVLDLGPLAGRERGRNWVTRYLGYKSRHSGRMEAGRDVCHHASLTRNNLKRLVCDTWK